VWKKRTLFYESLAFWLSPNNDTGGQFIRPPLPSGKSLFNPTHIRRLHRPCGGDWLGFLDSWLSPSRTRPPAARGDVLSLARAHHLSTCDAAYPGMALRCGLLLATYDDQFKSVFAN
jgi:hypothetical protein